MNDERDFTPSRGNRDLSLIGTRDVPARSHEHQALRLLQRLYFFRVASSAVWIAAIIALKGSFDAGGSITLIAAALAAYPALDGLVTLIDLRIPASASVQKLLWCNLAAGLTAAALEVVPSGGIDTKIRAFGLWAVASGAVQMLLGASRQPWLSRQWLMIISGAGSVLAGLTFATWAGSGPNGLSALEQYSLGGAAWYLITAAWFLSSSRRDSHNQRTGSCLPPHPGPQP